MASLNKVMLIGALGADPEIRRLPAGGSVANLRLATSETWRDKNTGEKREKTEWHTVTVFNDNLVRLVEQYTRKGSKLYIEGQLQTRKYQAKDGSDRYSTEIVIQGFGGNIVLLGEPAGNRSEAGTRREFASAPSASSAPHPAKGLAEARRDDFDDEIPF